MWEDPIVAEVHRIREKLAAEHNFDVKLMFEDMRRRQEALGARLVRQPPRKDEPAVPKGEHKTLPTVATPPETVPVA
jgi:hypothetical protein